MFASEKIFARDDDDEAYGRYGRSPWVRAMAEADRALDRALDRRIAAAERDCAALGLSFRSRMDAAAAIREQQHARAVRASGAGLATTSGGTSSGGNSPKPQRQKFSPTRDILGYAERHKIRPHWRETVEQFRSSGRGSASARPAVASALPSPNSASVVSSSSSHSLSSSSDMSSLATGAGGRNRTQ